MEDYGSLGLFVDSAVLNTGVNVAAEAPSTAAAMAQQSGSSTRQMLWKSK